MYHWSEAQLNKSIKPFTRVNHSSGTMSLCWNMSNGSCCIASYPFSCRRSSRSLMGFLSPSLTFPQGCFPLDACSFQAAGGSFLLPSAGCGWRLGFGLSRSKLSEQIRIQQQNQPRTHHWANHNTKNTVFDYHIWHYICQMRHQFSAVPFIQLQYLL